MSLGYAFIRFLDFKSHNIFINTILYLCLCLSGVYFLFDIIHHR